MRFTLSNKRTMLSLSERERYSRHLLIPEVGESGQERLKASRVLVIGLGGLGAPAVMYLAAAGVGTIGIMDGDTVSISNLQRQILYGSDQVGMLKTDAAYDRLTSLNPDIFVKRFPQYATRDNIEAILDEYDCVVEGTDTFSARYLINDACKKGDTPFVHGSVYRFEGNIALLGTRSGPCYRCIFPVPPPPELVPSCAEAGVLGVVPGLTGVMQATECIQFLLRGDKEVESINWTTVDLKTTTFRTIQMVQDPACSVCSKDRAEIQLVDYEAFCDGVFIHEENRISAEHLAGKLGDKGNLFLIDVRNTEERKLGHIGGEHWPIGDLHSRLTENQIPSDRDIILYCRSGRRSAVAVRLFQDAGFENVRHLEGGLLAMRDYIETDLIL